MVDARLFDLYEHRGDDNRDELFYREAAEVYSRVLRAEHRTPYTISKEELRLMLAHQEKNREPGWKKSTSK
jgi:hypothetical protein